MEEQFEIKLTKEDLKKGTYQNPWNCPVFHKLLQMFPGCTPNVWIEDFSIYSKEEDIRREYQMEPEFNDEAFKTALELTTADPTYEYVIIATRK